MDYIPHHWLQTFKTENSRPVRWALTLQPFCFSIDHQPRWLNIAADFQSRLQTDKQLEMTDMEKANDGDGKDEVMTP